MEKIKPRNIKGIPDNLFREAKAEAARQGIKIGQLVVNAINLYLNTPKKK